MAELRLDTHQVAAWNPGPVCLRCGRPSSCVVEKAFSYTPRAAGVVHFNAALALLAGDRRLSDALATRRCVLSLPLCDRCRSHWRRHRWLTAGFVLAFLLLLALLVAWINWTWGSLLEIRNQGAVEALLLGFLGIGALMVGAAALVRGPIRAKEITDEAIILTGVAADFPGAGPGLPWWRSRPPPAKEALTKDTPKPEAGLAGVSRLVLFGVALIVVGLYFLAEGKIPSRYSSPIEGPAVPVIAVALLGAGVVLSYVGLRRGKK